MGTTIRTKVHKKQPAVTPAPEAPVHADTEYTKKLEQAALELEDAVFHVLNSDKGDAFHDVDFLYWNRKLKNVATQISLALNEFEGPRRFHYHYRHDPKDYDTLYPVAGPTAIDMLTRVCREALSQCAEMVGVQDEHSLFERNRLEQAIRQFLLQCQAKPNGAQN